MSWWDKLKQVVKIDVHWNAPLFNICISKDSNNKTLFRDGYYYDQKNDTLHINPDKLPDGNNILKDATKRYIEEGNTLLDTSSKDLLSRLVNFNRETKDKSILRFFEKIIPPADLEALEASLFLRSQFKERLGVHNIKQDIRKRFGDRGNNIANLCTAGYFEEFLIPLYNSSQETFSQVYEEVVGKSIVAVFVHSQMSTEEIRKEIEKRISISRKYGIKFIHIHGISIGNVLKIKQCIQDQKTYFDFFDKNIYESEDKDIIVVELLFA